jgi:ubiquinone/menaquinone biosynthesis C-methylase UbiE
MSHPKTSHFDQYATTWDDNPARITLMKAIGEAILREVQPTREMNVLDYGCGTGLVGLFLLPHVGTVTGADNSVGMLDVLRQKIRAGGLTTMRSVRLDLEGDPLPAERYDLIVSNMTLHHIADTGKVLGACAQLLTARGTLCIADLAPEPGSFHPPEMADSVHHHGFDPEELAAQLSRLGFQRTKHSTAHSVRKPVADGTERDFPVFLIVARKEAT